MIKDLYINLKKQIEYYLQDDIKYVALYNSQYQHSNGTGTDGRNESAFNYPAVFLEFNNFEYRDLSLGLQEYDFTLTTHLGFKSFKKEDTDVLELIGKLYYVVQRFQQGSFARMSRRSEVWDYDHPNVAVLKTTFRGYGKDDYRYVYADQVFTSITGVTLSATTVNLSALTTATNLSGYSDSNGNNEFNPATDVSDDDEDN